MLTTFLKGFTLRMAMRLGGERNTPKHAYSSECVEGLFCELRLDGVLRSTAIIQNQEVGKGPSRVQPFLRLTPRRVLLSAFGRIALL